MGKHKAIFVDMDGTLCVADSMPSKKTAEAIKKAQNGGHRVFLCTGRAEGLIPQFIREMKLDGIISGSGAYVSVGNKCVVDVPFPKDTITGLLELFSKHGIIIMLGTAESIYIDMNHFLSLDIASAEGVNSEMLNLNNMARSGWMVDISQYSADIGVYNILFFAEEENQLPMLRPTLEGMGLALVGHPADRPGVITNIELVRKTVNKGSALMSVCDYIGVDAKDSIGFGDSMNDYEMLASAGLGVAMGNGDDEIKKHADLICGSVYDDGLADAFKELGLV